MKNVADKTEIRCATNLATYLAQAVCGITLPDVDRKAKVTAICFGAAQEHFAAMVLLLSNETPFYGSAFALTRSVVDAFLRGLWINFCATDDQIQRFWDGKNPPNSRQMLDDIEAFSGKDSIGSLRKVHGVPMQLLHQYVHTGGEVLRRWDGDHFLQPNYRETDIDPFLQLGARLAISSTTGIAMLADKPALAREIHDHGKQIMPKRKAAPGNNEEESAP